MVKARLALCGLFVAGLLWPAAVAAQSAPDANAPIVVTGPGTTPEKKVRRLTRAITPFGDATEPLARFQAPVCPISVGLPPELNKRLADRITQDAVDAGILAGRAGCAPNIAVIFVENGQAAVRGLRRTGSTVLSGVSSDTARRLEKDSGPVHAWSTTQVRSSDGDTLRAGGMIEGVPELQVRMASILLLPTRIDINASIVLIDIPAAIGKSVNQLADYAAMRTLAQTRPGSGGSDTILNLFGDGGPPARGLTGFDAGYLKALYTGPTGQPPISKVGMIARSINKAAAKRSAADAETR